METPSPTSWGPRGPLAWLRLLRLASFRLPHRFRSSVAGAPCGPVRVGLPSDYSASGRQVCTSRPDRRTPEHPGVCHTRATRQGDQGSVTVPQGYSQPHNQGRRIRSSRAVPCHRSSKPLIPVARMPVWSENRGKPLPADAVSCLTAEVVYQAGCWEPVPGPFIVAASTRISFRYAHGSCGRRPTFDAGRRPGCSPRHMITRRSSSGSRR